MVKKVEVIHGVISNPEEIVRYIESKTFKYTSRKKESIFSNFIGVSDFDTLPDSNMDEELLRLILKNTPENQYDYSFIQIQRYKPGQFILPHKDNYTTMLRLFNLTSSPYDGLCVQSEDTYVHLKDIAGSEIIFDPQAWHWINPVRDLRYSLVIGK